MNKNKHKSPSLFPVFSVLLGMLVLLHGIHGKDLLGLTALAPHINSKLNDEIKLLHELHHHIDKQTLKSLTQAADGVWQLTMRSMRLLKQHSAQQLRVSMWQRWATYFWVWIALRRKRKDEAWPCPPKVLEG